MSAGKLQYLEQEDLKQYLDASPDDMVRSNLIYP